MLFQVAFFLGGLILAGVIVLVALKWESGDVRGINPAGAVLAVLAVLTGIIGCASVIQVNPSEVGVVVELGRIQDKTLGEGPHLLTPFIQHAEIMDLQVHKHEAPAEAASKDLQDVQATVAVNYRLDSRQAAKVYQDLRRDYVV